MSCEDRISRVREAMEGRHIDALLVRHNADLRWLTGLAGVFDEECAHAALITQDALYFHTDSRYIDTFRKRLEATDWQLDDSHCAPILALTRMHEAPIASLGIEHDLPLCEYRMLEKHLEREWGTFELEEVRDLIFSLRAVKDEGELALIAEAQKITDAAFEHICSFMHVGMTEREVAFELEYFMRRQGADGLAFPSIVAAGAHGASPHCVPGDVQIADGDMVVMDFGASLADYRSDMTRTVCMGRPNTRQNDVYAIVADVNSRAKDLVKAGVACKDVHLFAACAIADAGFGKCFGHGLGHGVGIDIHEMPTLSAHAEGNLVDGNVVTIEPGIYLPGDFGVRIEDFGVVRSDGFEVFTASPHELMVL